MSAGHVWWWILLWFCQHIDQFCWNAHTGWLEETVNYKLIIDWARKPEIHTESSVSLMTFAKKGQPPPNYPKEWQDTHSIASYSFHHLRRCTLHVKLYMLDLTNFTLYVTLYTLHFSPCPLHVALWMLHFTCSMLHFIRCTLHIALYMLYFTHWSFHMILYILRFAH